ncbi:MAG: transaldolase family protein [Infirmifilum sp.]|jgi:hypothetical protein|uniref:transaldolase family protein n=2 Tax=Thermofilaceae TaxID=114378 RepID=UPI002353A54D
MDTNIYDYRSAFRREELPETPPVSDQVSLAVYVALRGYPDLGADNLLNPRLATLYSRVIGEVNRVVHLSMLSAFEKGNFLESLRLYYLLGELALNTIGMEMRWAGIPPGERSKSLEFILGEIASLEELEKKSFGNTRVAAESVNGYLDDMRKVMSSNPKAKSMLAWMADEVSRHIDPDHPLSSFIIAMRSLIDGNAYYRMTLNGLCRFGNDYALGLRWLRRLGFVQVSTNPVLAAEAYKDDPRLWERYEEYLSKHPELLERPEERADDLAMTATLLALIPNMEVFRPVAFLLGFKDGMVSYQLNPNFAESVEDSIRDALKIYSLAAQYFKLYDAYLLWGWPDGMTRGRPNIVFKVAGSGAASLEITRILESLGIGTNNTVTFSVSQEVSLILEKIRGRSEAAKRGVRLTKVYMTNMGGRLEAHLREVKAAELIRTALRFYEDPEGSLLELARSLGVPVLEKGGTWRGPSGWGYDIVARTLDEKVELVSSQAYLRTLLNDALIDFLARVGVCGASRDEVRECLEAWERALSLSGTFVAQRVWYLFFDEENRRLWLSYIMRKYGLSAEQAEEVLDGIDVLPASKRRPEDTYYTLSARNMTNTEFPNHQLNVHLEYQKKSLRLEDLAEAVRVNWGPESLDLLLKMPEFRKAYEVTREIKAVLLEVGVKGAGELGEEGLRVDEWKSFGPRVKTMRGFTEAYNKFREECLKRAKNV